MMYQSNTTKLYYVYYCIRAINKLVRAQTITPNDETKFYPRVINKTNIGFTDEEVTLLKKD